MHDFIPGLVMLAVGILAIALYSVVARKRFKSNLDFVQVIIYRVDTKTLPVGDRILEFILRIMKFFGLVMAVVGPFVMFH